jgi:hypothetical protein
MLKDKYIYMMNIFISEYQIWRPAHLICSVYVIILLFLWL